MFLAFTWDGLVANDHSFLDQGEGEISFKQPSLHSIHLPASNHL